MKRSNEAIPDQLAESHPRDASRRGCLATLFAKASGDWRKWPRIAQDARRFWKSVKLRAIRKRIQNAKKHLHVLDPQTVLTIRELAATLEDSDSFYSFE